MPSVSVVIPTLNRSDWIKQAIDSVLAQTFDDYEIIVVDDGSTDDTRQVVNELQQNNTSIKYHYQNNRGRSASRNIGIYLAQGKWIAFLDSDDLFMPDKLKIQFTALQSNPEYGMSYSDALAVNEQGRAINNRPLRLAEFTGQIYPGLLFLKGTMITTPTVMARREVLLEVGGFDETMSVCEDLDLWRRIARKYPVLQIRQPLSVIRYRKSEKNNWADFLGARLVFYQKAFADDPALIDTLKPKLCAEAYCHYGLLAVLRERQVKLGLQWLGQAARYDLIQFFRSVVKTVVGLGLGKINYIREIQRSKMKK